MSSYTKELKVAKEAARQAQRIILDYHRERSFEIDFKGEKDLVTDADLEAERVILQILREAFPGDYWMAEESAENFSDLNERTWLIDPIDGTTNFAHGFPVFCVSIALWEEQNAKVAVVLEVNYDDLFTAVKGEGARLDGEKIKVSGIDTPDNALIGTGFPYNDLSLVDEYMEYFRRLMDQTQGVRRPGSAAFDLCCVASGRFEGFYEYSLNPWDVAAASLIVEEAGGVVSDWTGGDDWLFGERIVAGNPPIHEYLLKQMQDVFSASSRKAVRS